MSRLKGKRLASLSSNGFLIYSIILLLLLSLLGGFIVSSILHLASELYTEEHAAASTASNTTNVSAPIKLSLGDAFRYIPQSTVDTWTQRNYLIVFGIPSMDVDGRRRRRNLQRNTCWQFPGVARKDNNFTGDMLVLYLLGKHLSNRYQYTDALVKEVSEWHDIIMLSVYEGRFNTSAIMGFAPSEREGFHLALSSKVLFWFEFVLRFFPKVRFIAKGDDDIFLRVPQFLTDLRTLPHRGLYWGDLCPAKLREGNVTLKYRFALGPCYTLGRDAVQRIVSYTPLQRLISQPYSSVREAEYGALELYSEDAMIGLVLRKSGYYNRVVFVKELGCSFHDVYSGVRTGPVRRSSIMVHHLGEDDYGKLFNMFRNDTGHRRRRQYVSKSNFRLVCK